MATRSRKLVGVLSGAVLAVAGAIAGAAPAQANPSWTLYDEGTGAPLASADPVTGTGTLTFALTIAGSPRTMTCSFTAADPLTLTAGSTVSGPPGSTLTLPVAPLSTTCRIGTLPVTVVSGGWALSVTLPGPGSAPGQLYDGSVSASLTAPASSTTWDFSYWIAGCTATGPSVGRSFLGSYSASTGALTENVNQAFAMTATGCTVTSTRLVNGSITLAPVVDLQW